MLAGIYVSGVLDLGKVAFSEGTAEFVAADPRPGVGVALVAHWSRREGARRGQRRRAALRPPFLVYQRADLPKSPSRDTIFAFKRSGYIVALLLRLDFWKREEEDSAAAGATTTTERGREGRRCVHLTI